MAAKLELKKSKSGQYHFNLNAGNGQIIATSEMYESNPVGGRHNKDQWRVP